MDDLQYSSPTGNAARESSSHGFDSGSATDHAPAADPIQQLRQLTQDHMSGIHIDPSLQSHSNHAQQLAQDAIESLTQPSYSASESPAVQTAAAAAAAAAAARTKTSRACDECRRKKIRCDGSSEMEMGACSACKRSGRPCAYSRTPQKRGPNRGYIRDLTQRVELLERERNDISAPVQSQDWAFLNADEIDETIPAAYDQTTTKRAGDPLHSSQIAVLSPLLITGYFTHIHPVLPLLPADNEDINAVFQNTPPETIAAFTQALELCLNSPFYTGTISPPYPMAVRHAFHTFNTCKASDPQNVAQVHTALLLVVDCINRGANAALNRAGFDPWATFKDFMTLALDNNVFEAGMNASSVDEDGTRRLALVICTLELLMFNANKRTEMVTQAVDDMPRPEDRETFGRMLFEMSRMTHILRRALRIEVVDSVEGDGQATYPSPFGGDYKIRVDAKDVATLRAHKEHCRNELTSILLEFNYNEDPVVRATFWYARLLIEIHFYPLAKVSRLFYILNRLIQFVQSLTPVNLLNHHFTGIAAHVLFQLLEFSDTRSEALAHLDALGDILERMVPAHDTDSFDAAIKEVVARKRHILHQNSSNLEQLANVAVGNTDESAADHGVAEAAAAAAQAALGGAEFNGALLSQEGYLTAILGGL